MKHFTNEAIETAKARSQELLIKLGSLRPTDELTLEDIRGISFYLSDYIDELQSLEYRRKLNREA